MKLIISLLFILSSFCIFSQTISGKVMNINGEKILYANVIIRDSINAINMKEFVIAKNGFYSISLSKAYNRLVIEVSANKYQADFFLIDNFDSKKNYIHNFTLTKDTIVKLKEVIITAKQKSFQIKGDTVKYNVASYKDGTERKIQDVIKKLPGIELNEKTGEIRYKGQSVETVKLDGDDLFASNYSIGTKNINVDMVEQVQVIEKYSENPLLKGIESGNKVALNLTLKKRKTDYSESIDLGMGALGSNTAIDASTNLLGISKKYKSFATFSYNNVGTNNTPFDYFSYNPNVEQLKEYIFLAKKYISDSYFDTDIDPERNNINNAFFGSYNATFKVGEILNLKTNLFYLTDKINSEQSIVSSNDINGQQFTTSDQFSIFKTPVQYRGDIEAKYYISKKSLLEYSAKYKIENINTLNNLLQNKTSAYHTELNTKENYFKQTLIYTRKLSAKKAFQLTIRQALNDAPQKFTFTPAIFEPLTYSSNIQLSKFKKNSLNIESNLLANVNKGKYTTSLGTYFQQINYTSTLQGKSDNNEQSIANFNNNFIYLVKTIYTNVSDNIQFKYFRLIPTITLTYLQQDLSEKQTITKNTSNFLIEPSFTVNYKINDFSAFLINTTYRQKPFSEEYLINSPVFLSNRLIKYNQISLTIQKSKIINAFYIINNLYKQFQLNIGGNYSETKGNFFSNLLVQENNTKLVNFFLPESNRILSLNLIIEKYIPFLQGTVRLKNDYSLQHYKNIVNNSLLRNNTSMNNSIELFFKTAFDSKINFENTIKHHITDSKTESGFQFSNQTINNNFQIIIKPTKRLFFLFSTDYFLPDIKKKKESYLFFDSDINYQTKNKVYNFHFKARNITNNKTLNQFDTNDFSTTNSQTNLLPIQLIFSISRNF